MTAKYDRTEGTATDYDYSTTEKTMAKKDTAVENNDPKRRFIKTIEGNPKIHVTVRTGLLNGLIKRILVTE